MSQAPLDLSKLPAPIRAKLQAQLDKLPPELRQQMLERAAPSLQRVMDQAADRIKSASPPTSVASAARRVAAKAVRYEGHYNGTVQPGDRLQMPVGTIVFVIVVLGLWYRFFAGG